MRLGEFLAVICWGIGIWLAKGFWSTFFAVIFPPWAWLVVCFQLAEKYFS